ncbi:flavodoxin [Clostridium carboxidivorans P7]|uniref:NAD(P)H dehydrogenase (Quinone) n=1 Tax=Clostridium carboxidivorans P7 TaxID=536227 RepID=C6PRU1_9CLOT|nr:flavodoxin family protein [Clostridium carboxidivorans]AKN30048.1 flavodoxin [Clostridium carboxidivorans P7]EET87993.1 NAD(P)H dehydrogenase (quinone) [Clostridium carboxidivorans P7]EFG89053.1 flavodoxin-like fold protein [Clostridium carboxidivorans P7]
MKITVITGSPHKKGTTALLADNFIAGATEAGHDVYRFDAAFQDVKPCLSCGYCESHKSECVYKDSMRELNEKLFESDVVVFVTPIYYYTMSAQIKAVVDRFHANNAKLSGNKKAMIFAAAYGADDGTMEGLQKTYEAILRYLNWKDTGVLFAKGCPTRESIEETGYLQQAYEMGKALV